MPTMPHLPFQEANPLDTSHAGHSLSATVGDVDVARMGFDPSVLVRTFDYGEATTMADGTTVREWEIAAYDKEIEIAPGVFFPAWTYNGRVPGPTLRANEGDRLRIHFHERRSHPHTMHFHGIHSASRMASPGIGRDEIPARSSSTSSRPSPSAATSIIATRLPLKRHIHKGMYGAYIVDPDPAKQRGGGASSAPRHARNRRVAGARDGDERLRHQL